MQSLYNHRSILTLAAAVFVAACSSGPGTTPDSGSDPDGGSPRVGPPTIEFKPAKYDCVVAQPCSINAPVVGGAIATYSIAPQPPDGMTFDTKVGNFTGSPKAAMAETTYTVTATNSLGKATASFSVTVFAGELAPATLTYATNPANYTVGLAITANKPSNSGGKPTAYNITPALPNWLVMDPLTGVISGTPLAVTASTTYTVTASNGAGQTTVALTLAVNDIAPKSLVYSTPAAVYSKGSAATPNTPTVTGGKATSYLVSPALPAGLSLDKSTGVISGTPSAVISATNFTVTAVNSGGSVTASVNITVNDAAPSNLRYSLNPAVYAKNKTITPNALTSSGGTPTSFAVSPTLPAGLALDAAGVLSGTPTSESPATDYVVTATNSGGSATVTLSIEVKVVAPTGITYSVNPASYRVHTLITPNVPTTTGAAPTNYSVSPALPAGLSLSGTTGIISGTPTAAASKGAYTVTASTSGGQVSVILEVEVADDPPSALVYTTPQAVYRRGTTIASNRPANSGGVATAYVVDPALPAGLQLNASTGEISGTPTALTAQATYKVTASNASGSTSTDLTITVQEMAPAGLTYAQNPATYNDGSKIADNAPSSTGGPIVSYAVSPVLPTGLTMDTATGVISGTPIGAAALATYTVTASNGTDIATVDLQLEVKERIPGIYIDNLLLLDKAVSTTWDQPLTFAAGAHTLEIAGVGDYTINGSISGAGTVTISVGDGNTLFLNGAQLNPGLTVASGTVDLMSLKWAFGSPTRSGTGTIKRYANPSDLTSKLRAWFDASNELTLFSDASRTSSQRTAGGVVHGWTNLADPSKSASTLNGLPMWSVNKDSIVLSNAAFSLGALDFTGAATVIAVVKTTAQTGVVPAIFSAEFDSAGVPVMLGADPLARYTVPTVSAGQYSAGLWKATDAQPITLDKKQMFGATYGSAGISLQIDGSMAANNPTALASILQSNAYRIGRRWDVADYWNGNFFEIVASNDTNNIEALSGYVAWHNGLESVLPDTHKFKAAPPTVVISASGSTIQ